MPFTSPLHLRYNIAKNQWQSVASSNTVCDLSQNTFCNKAAAVHKSCLYVLYAQGIQQVENLCYVYRPYNSLLYCFDPKRNAWEQKASTKTPHLGSSLLVVNNKLYVAGGSCSFQSSMYEPYGSLTGDPAAIEVYNDQINAWSVVKQTHIPQNNHGAVEIEGRVYFIINSFPVYSGITIPPGEVYSVDLDEWKSLKLVNKNAVLCYFAIKTENLPTLLRHHYSLGHKLGF